MEFNPKKCPKCKGRSTFHIADRVAFAGDKSHFSLGWLSDSAKMEGLRVHGSTDNLVALISKANSRISSSVRTAKSRGIKIMMPEDFEIEIKKVCDGNVSTFRNPTFKSRLKDGGRIFAWGLDTEQEKLLAKFIKRNNMKKTEIRKETLSASITTTIFLKTPEAKILKALGVPVYDFSRIADQLEN
jgi:hypothetical protein